jgi:hypothetical protein
MRKVDFLLLLAVASLVISVVPIAGALYETNTDDEGVYTLSNLPPGTYTITAIASGYPKKIAGHLKAMGEINVTLREGEHLNSKDIMVDMDKKLKTIPVDPGEGRGSISGKVLVYEPFFKKIIPVPSKLSETKVVITRYEDNLRII